jgi:hypothetical protein
LGFVWFRAIFVIVHCWFGPWMLLPTNHSNCWEFKKQHWSGLNI